MDLKKKSYELCSLITFVYSTQLRLGYIHISDHAAKLLKKNQTNKLFIKIMKTIVILFFDLVLNQSKLQIYHVLEEDLQDRLEWVRKNFDKDVQRGWISPIYEVKVVDIFRISSL